MLKFISSFFKKKKNKGKLCDCSRRILESTEGWSLEHFPLKGGYHTHIEILVCRECQGYFSFPSDNLELAFREITPEGADILLKIGFDDDLLREVKLLNM